MDPTLIAALIPAVMREVADFQDRAAAGTITAADIAKMLSLLDHTLDSWQAEIDRKKAI